MLTFLGRPRRYCDGISRRDFLKVGALSVGSLSMADLLRMRAEAALAPSGGRAPAADKSVIMVFLHGGPSHLDMYDMKPDAPVEFRGEFRPIHGNVPGMDLCELMPRQAQITDKLAILRGLHFVEEHSAHSLWTGYPERVHRPAFGSVVSYLKGRQDGLPPYVSLMNQPLSEDPAYCGTAHRPFVPTGPGLENLGLVSGVSLDRLNDRKALLSHLDTIRRDIDYRGALAGLDAYTVRALDMVASTKTREAFDIGHETSAVREKYGPGNEDFLRARRLVEAGISVVTLVVGGWDTHGNNFGACARCCPSSIRASRPWSAICTNGAAIATWPWSCGANSAGRRASTPPRDAITGRGPVSRSWPAAISRPARQSAKPTPTAKAPRDCR